MLLTIRKVPGPGRTRPVSASGHAGRAGRDVLGGLRHMAADPFVQLHHNLHALDEADCYPPWRVSVPVALAHGGPLRAPFPRSQPALNRSAQDYTP